MATNSPLGCVPRGGTEACRRSAALKSWNGRVVTVEPEHDFVVPVIPPASLADFAFEQGSLSEALELRAHEHALRISEFVRRVGL